MKPHKAGERKLELLAWLIDSQAELRCSGLIWQAMGASELARAEALENLRYEFGPIYAEVRKGFSRYPDVWNQLPEPLAAHAAGYTT